jgi:hypothetical protein
MKINFTKILIVLLIAAGIFTAGYFTGSAHKEAQYNEALLKDPVDTSYYAVLAKPHIDTIIVKKFDPVKGDTVFKASPPDTIYYIASADTSFRNDSLNVNVSWHSTVPVDAKGYFEINIKEKLKTAIQLVEIDLPFYKKFTFGFIAGMLAAILTLLVVK